MLRSTFLCRACILSFFPVHRLSGVHAGVISQFVIMLDENLQHFHFHTSSISGNVEGISVHKQIRVVMLTLQCCRCDLDWKCLWRLRRLAPSPLGSLELIQAYPCFSNSFKTGIPNQAGCSTFWGSNGTNFRKAQKHRQTVLQTKGQKRKNLYSERPKGMWWTLVSKDRNASMKIIPSVLSSLKQFVCESLHGETKALAVCGVFAFLTLAYYLTSSKAPSRCCCEICQSSSADVSCANQAFTGGMCEFQVWMPWYGMPWYVNVWTIHGHVKSNVW